MKRLACALFVVGCGAAVSRVEPVCPAPTRHPDVVVTGPRSFRPKTLADYDACSRCRATACCPQEAACRDDRACAEAAGALDECVKQVHAAMAASTSQPDVAAPDWSARERACSARFARTGEIARRRAACATDRCARECSNDFPFGFGLM